MSKAGKATATRDRFFIPAIIAVSVLIPLIVVALMILPGRAALGDVDVSSQPFVHALLNGGTAILLTVGYLFMRAGQITRHRNCMLGALGLSTIFLVSYVLYHASTGHTPFGGQGAVRYLYFTVLISHVSLAIFVVPMALFSVYRGLGKQIDKHRRIARWTFPIWLYVAVTGVLVYLFMFPYYA